MELAFLEYSIWVPHGFILMVSPLLQIIKKACYTSLTPSTMLYLSLHFGNELFWNFREAGMV